MHVVLILIYVFLLVACEEAPQSKHVAEPVVKYNNGLNVTTRVHFLNDLGNKSISGLSAPVVTWRFLSHKKGYPGINVSGVCKVDWRNDTDHPINGFYHIAFQDENNLLLAHVQDRPLSISAKLEKSTAYHFTINLADLGVVNLVENAWVVFTIRKLENM